MERCRSDSRKGSKADSVRNVVGFVSVSLDFGHRQFAERHFPPMQYTFPSSAPMTIAPPATAGLPVIGEPIS